MTGSAVRPKPGGRSGGFGCEGRGDEIPDRDDEATFPLAVETGTASLAFGCDRGVDPAGSNTIRMPDLVSRITWLDCNQCLRPGTPLPTCNSQSPADSAIHRPATLVILA